MILAMVLIAAGLISLVLGLRHEIRAVKPTVSDEDWTAPHAGWVEQHDIDRRFDLITADFWKADAS